ncbi:MAG TPA: hypothetical protein VK698_11420 [Kofleriaceae bacterium]|nr:hypothetical protein [Kofleriaceae bacterium]
MAESRLTMNPFADIHVHPPPEALPIDPGAVEVITIKCPVRGRGLVVRDLTADRDPALFGFFLAVIEESGELELDADAPIAPALVEIGFLVPDDRIYEWPRFAVPLPDAGVSGAGAAPRDADWIVADDLLFQPSFALHPGVSWPADFGDQDGLLGCFAPGPALWVGEPGQLVAPFWVESDAAALLERFVAGQPPPPIPAALHAALASIGALVPRGAPRRDPLARFGRLRESFAAHRHAIARAVLHPAELAALRRYYAALLADGLVRLGDRQSDRRYSSYNDPVGRFVQARLTPLMAAVTARQVDPTFSYFFSYVDGAELAPHTDRDQAELSISLQLDYSPAPAAVTGWPLRFTGPAGEAAADLAIGDAVLYHGRELTHHRAALPAGHQSSHLVLEYVPVDFAGLRA